MNTILFLKQYAFFNIVCLIGLGSLEQ